MNYAKTMWIDGVTEVKSEYLNNMENGIEMGVNYSSDNKEKINILNSSLSTFNIANYGHISGDDITSTIKDILSKCKKGDIIFIPKGEYYISETIKIPAYVTLRGQHWRDSILKSNNCDLLNIEGDSILNSNGSGHVQGIVIDNISLYVQDQNYNIITAKAASHILFENVYFFGALKSALDAVEFFDVRWINCFFYWCGDSEGNYPVLNFRNELNYEYNNNHFFYGCMFESNRGQLLRIDAEHNTEFKFTNCKFENTDSSVTHIYLKDCGAIYFNNCMISAEGRNSKLQKNIIEINNCWDVEINGTLYKWDDLNGNRSSYSIPECLIDVVNSREYRLNIALYNHIVRLQDSNKHYVRITNVPSDGSYVNLMMHPDDTSLMSNSSQHYTHPYNVYIKHNLEPTFGLESYGTSWQTGRITKDGEDTKYRLIYYDKDGVECEVYNTTKNKWNQNIDTFFGKGVYLGRYSGGKQPWGYGGCVYYDTDNNQYKFYVEGKGWGTLNLQF